MTTDTDLIKAKEYIYWYPIMLSAIGVGIHFLGTLGLFQLEVHRLAHLIMFIIDFMVVLGLLKKSKRGYLLAILLYIEQSIMQPYWAYLSFIAGFGIFQLLVTSPLVIIALIILIFNKSLFIKKQKDLT
jgi:hypothetical protein